MAQAKLRYTQLELDRNGIIVQSILVVCLDSWDRCSSSQITTAPVGTWYYEATHPLDNHHRAALKDFGEKWILLHLNPWRNTQAKIVSPKLVQIKTFVLFAVSIVHELFLSDTVLGDISSGRDPSEPDNQTEISFHFRTFFSMKHISTWTCRSKQADSRVAHSVSPLTKAFIPIIIPNYYSQLLPFLWPLFLSLFIWFWHSSCSWSWLHSCDCFSQGSQHKRQFSLKQAWSVGYFGTNQILQQLLATYP